MGTPPPYMYIFSALPPPCGFRLTIILWIKDDNPESVPPHSSRVKKKQFPVQWVTTNAIFWHTSIHGRAYIFIVNPKLTPPDLTRKRMFQLSNSIDGKGKVVGFI